jgi:hypothetical protein
MSGSARKLGTDYLCRAIAEREHRVVAADLRVATTMDRGEQDASKFLRI